MSEAYKIQGATLDAIAEAIQEARGLTEPIAPGDMPGWILGTKQEVYPGPYSYVFDNETLRDTKQKVFSTQDQLMSDDLIVTVPVSDVSNPQGGRTYTIGG